MEAPKRAEGGVVQGKCGISSELLLPHRNEPMRIRGAFRMKASGLKVGGKDAVISSGASRLKLADAADATKSARMHDQARE